jgi:hypothetical protein
MSELATSASATAAAAAPSSGDSSSDDSSSSSDDSSSGDRRRMRWRKVHKLVSIKAARPTAQPLEQAQQPPQQPQPRSKKSTAADCVDAALTPTTSTVLCQFVGGRPMGVILSTTSADPRTVAGIRAGSQAGLAPELKGYFLACNVAKKIAIGTSTVADCSLLIARPGIVVKLSQVDGQNLRGVADTEAIQAVTKVSLQALDGPS